MNDKWIIFDMDNTLIDTDPLYMRATDQLGEFLSNHGVLKSKVLKLQREIDAELFKTYGYAAHRFVDSFEETAIQVLTNSKYHLTYIDSVVQRVRRMALNVFDQQSKEYEYSAKVVRQFLRAGYKIAVITAGDIDIQMKRFNQLTMHNLFHDCWVVPNKDSQVFEDFCSKHNVEKCGSWMIGDSLYSDILPAAEVGLNTIHVQTASWQAVNVKKKDIPDSVISVKDLSCVADIVFGIKV